MAAPAPSDSREELWKACFDTYYDSLFEEMTADALITWWGSLDEVTKVLVAITASGSAVSGWALWSQPAYKVFWLICSGVAALLSVMHTALGVPGRIKAHAEDKRRFAALRTDLETFRYRMRVDQDGFDVGQFTKEFLEYRRRYSENTQLVSSDMVRTSRLEVRMQSKLNVRLQNETEQE